MGRTISFVSDLSGKPISKDQSYTLTLTPATGEKVFTADLSAAEAVKLAKECNARTVGKRGRKPGSKSSPKAAAKPKRTRARANGKKSRSRTPAESTNGATLSATVASNPAA